MRLCMTLYPIGWIAPEPHSLSLLHLSFSICLGSLPSISTVHKKVCYIPFLDYFKKIIKVKLNLKKVKVMSGKVVCCTNKQTNSFKPIGNSKVLWLQENKTLSLTVIVTKNIANVLEYWQLNQIWAKHNQQNQWNCNRYWSGKNDDSK